MFFSVCRFGKRKKELNMEWTYMETLACIFGGLGMLWFFCWAFRSNRELKRLYDKLMQEKKDLVN